MGLLQQSMPAFLISMIIGLVGLYITLYWIVINKGNQVDGTLLYLGIFSILLGLWSANETNMAALIFVNLTGMLLSCICYPHVMPMPFLLFAKSFLEIHDSPVLENHLCDGLCCDRSGPYPEYDRILRVQAEPVDDTSDHSSGDSVRSCGYYK